MGEGKGSGTVNEVIEGFIIIGDCKKVGSICNYVYYLKLSMSYKSYIYVYILLENTGTFQLVLVSIHAFFAVVL